MATRTAPQVRADDAAPPASANGRAADGAAALDLLLGVAALGPRRRFVPGGAGVRCAAALARRPATVARRATALADPAWTANPVLRGLVQGYLAAGRTARDLVGDAELGWRDAERVGFIVDNLVEALAPSNSPVVNPAFWKALVDSGGASLARGLRHLVADLAAPPRIPAMVEPDAFEVGKDLGVTPGAVVLRTPVFELLQYAPQTPRVRRVPLLVVPPMINKHYIVDLAPGRSLIEFLVLSGQQVFSISWRNPDLRHRDWGVDVYGRAVLEALEATQRITRADRSALLALCSGGIIASMAVAHLAATGGEDRVAGLGLGVTVLDHARAGTPAAAIDARTARAAAAASAARGYLDGRALAEMFAWLRPGDLIWSYWVNNYLEGRPPKPFDILYWNADTTRMAARLHRDFLRMAVDNSLTRPGAATMLGSPVDLSAIGADSYVVAGVADHLCPWESCYRSTQLLGGRSRFVLSTSGHIASLVNPPGNEKATFRTAPDTPADPAAWLDLASTERGSWWPDYVAWLEERGGGERARPRRLGGAGFRPSDPAPGTYVMDR
jgi:polyhydroxyalkanoate synthase